MPVFSQVDSIFLKEVRALPEPLVEAMTDGELLDPGLLLAYLWMDPSRSDLDGSFLATHDVRVVDRGVEDASMSGDAIGTDTVTLHDSMPVQSTMLLVPLLPLLLQRNQHAPEYLRNVERVQRSVQIILMDSLVSLCQTVPYKLMDCHVSLCQTISHMLVDRNWKICWCVS